MKDFVNRLAKASVAYSNPTTKRARALFIVPKPGNARFRFTVDLFAINQFTIHHHYPMPLLKNEFPINDKGSVVWPSDLR